MVIAGFQIKNMLDNVQFFQKTFLLANINMKVVFGMLFITLSNANSQFVIKKLI